MKVSNYKSEYKKDFRNLAESIHEKSVTDYLYESDKYISLDYIRYNSDIFVIDLGFCKWMYENENLPVNDPRRDIKGIFSRAVISRSINRKNKYFLLNLNM